MYYDITIGVATFLATVLVAIVIYRLQDAKEKEYNHRMIENARFIMAADIENALPCFLVGAARLVVVAYGIENSYSMNVQWLNQFLTYEEARHLKNLVNHITFFVKEKQNGHPINLRQSELFFRDWIIPIINAKYEMELCLLDNYRNLYNKETFDLLKKLTGTKEQFDEDLCVLKNKEGEVIVEYDGTCQKHKIYEFGQLVFDGVFDVDGTDIYDGYKRDNKYDGMYKNGKYEGQGKTLSPDGHTVSRGTWKQGELIKGVEYNWVVKRFTNESFCLDDIGNAEKYDFLEQYGSECRTLTRDTQDYMCHDSIDDYCVVDVIVDGEDVNYQNLRLFDDFLNTRISDDSEFLREEILDGVDGMMQRTVTVGQTTAMK